MQNLAGSDRLCAARMHVARFVDVNNESGCSGPSTHCCTSITSCNMNLNLNMVSALACLPCAARTWAMLPIVTNVCGCSEPSTGRRTGARR
jgi:hypothetical protein